VCYRLDEREIEFLIEVKARINPSENPEKVLDAIVKLLKESKTETEFGEETVVVRTRDFRSLKHIKDMLRDRRIRAAARKLAEESKKENTFSLLVNRQAATVGILSLCSSKDESPLGPIEIVFSSDRIDELIDYLTSLENKDSI
jgi:predicted RNA binding protein with dsRBD fold (UPF0201 family)